VLELTESVEMARLDPADSGILQTLIRKSVERRLDIGLDMLQQDLTQWLQTRVYVTTMKKSEALFNSSVLRSDANRIKEAYAVISEMGRQIAEMTFEVGQVEPMNNLVGDFEQQKVDASRAITFGLPMLDRLLLPEGQGRGSLLPGDMTILLAPTNVGKTTAMVTVAAHNIWAGRNVLLVTHEGRTNDLKLKIWQSMMGLSRTEVMDRLAQPDFQIAIKNVQALVNKHLEFMPLNRAGMTVEDVGAAITLRQERWKSTHLGKGFDLLIDDYGAKLTTIQARGGQFQLRQIHEVVYNYFTQIALDLDLHLLTAIQTNREGSRTNARRGKNVEHRLIVMEDVSEAWGPMTTATNVISLNRDPASQAKGVVTWCILKSRSSEVMLAVIAESDFAAATSHSPQAKATWYRGTSTMSEKITNLLSSYAGQEIPWEVVLKAENGEAIE